MCVLSLDWGIVPLELGRLCLFMRFAVFVPLVDVAAGRIPQTLGAWPRRDGGCAGVRRENNYVLKPHNQTRMAEQKYHL